MEITVEVHAENGGYWAEVPELPGCLTSAGSLDELGTMLLDAVQLWTDDPGAQLLGVERLAPGSVQLALVRTRARDTQR